MDSKFKGEYSGTKRISDRHEIDQNKLEVYLNDNLEKFGKNSISFVSNGIKSISNMDATILMTNWSQYKTIRLDDINSTSLFIDSRGFLNVTGYNKSDKYISL